MFQTATTEAAEKYRETIAPSRCKQSEIGLSSRQFSSSLSDTLHTTDPLIQTCRLRSSQPIRCTAASFNHRLRGQYHRPGTGSPARTASDRTLPCSGASHRRFAASGDRTHLGKETRLACLRSHHLVHFRSPAADSLRCHFDDKLPVSARSRPVLKCASDRLTECISGWFRARTGGAHGTQLVRGPCARRSEHGAGTDARSRIRLESDRPFRRAWDPPVGERSDSRWLRLIAVDGKP